MKSQALARYSCSRSATGGSYVSASLPAAIAAGNDKHLALGLYTGGMLRTPAATPPALSIVGAWADHGHGMGSGSATHASANSLNPLLGFKAHAVERRMRACSGLGSGKMQ